MKIVNSKLKILTWFLVLGIWFFISCEPPVEATAYEEKLVVYGNLIANAPLMDTVFVSRSYEIDEPHESKGKWISNAEVVIVGAGDTVIMSPTLGNAGRYVDSTSVHIVQPNVEYTLDVTCEDYKEFQITATTLVPDSVFIQSVGSQDWECEGEPEEINPIDLHLENESMVQFAFTTGNPNLLLTLTMDTVVYREGPCYTTSFVSVPIFILEWESETEPGMVRVVSWALEDTVKEMEPFKDIDGDSLFDEGEPFQDINQSGERDLYLVNAIIDTSLSAMAFKGPMFRDEDGNYYRPNPAVWNLSQNELDFGWMSFNYYGVHLIIIQATDHNFSDYFEGDPFRQNQYILPNSNIEGGYGLFSSSYYRYFLVYVAPEY